MMSSKSFLGSCTTYITSISPLYLWCHTLFLSNNYCIRMIFTLRTSTSKEDIWMQNCICLRDSNLCSCWTWAPSLSVSACRWWYVSCEYSCIWQDACCTSLIQMLLLRYGSCVEQWWRNCRSSSSTHIDKYIFVEEVCLLDSRTGKMKTY